MADSPLLVLLDTLRSSPDLSGVAVRAGAASLPMQELPPRVVVYPRSAVFDGPSPHSGGTPSVLWHAVETIALHIWAASTDPERQAPEHHLDEAFKLRERVLRGFAGQLWQGYWYTPRACSWELEEFEVVSYGEACVLAVDVRLPVAKAPETQRAVSVAVIGRKTIE